MDQEPVISPERLKPKRRYIKQPNFLTVKKRDELTVMEQKILYLVMNQLDENDPRDKYTIRAADICSSTSKVVDALRKVLSRKITFINNARETKEIIPFIGYHYHKYQGLITMTIHPEALPVFFDKTRGYTSFNLEYALRLSSRYSQKLYEILSKWRDKKTLHLDVADLQRDLCAENKEYGQFKRDCLNVAMREINQKTEISFTYVEEKRGRRVVQLILCLVDKQKAKKQAAYSDAAEAVRDAEELSPEQVKECMTRMYAHYTFAPWQQDILIENRPMFCHFIKLDTLIDQGVLKPRDRTKYVASILFGKRSPLDPPRTRRSTQATKPAAGTAPRDDQARSLGDIIPAALSGSPAHGRPGSPKQATK